MFQPKFCLHFAEFENKISLLLTAVILSIHSFALREFYAVEKAFVVSFVVSFLRRDRHCGLIPAPRPTSSSGLTVSRSLHQQTGYEHAAGSPSACINGGGGTTVKGV